MLSGGNKLVFVQIAAKILVVAVQSIRENYWNYSSKTYDGRKKISVLFPDKVLAKLIAKSLNRSVHDAVLHGELLSIRTLKTNYLDDTKVTNLEGIGYLGNMKKLQLFDTALSQLPEEIQHLQRLQHLEIEGGLISEIPDCLYLLPKLKVLILKKQLLVDLPNMKEQQVNIRILSLEANNFSEVPVVLSSFLLLERFNISNNPVRQLPQFLTDLPYLHELDFSRTHLENIPSALIKTKHMYQLNIHDTPIDKQLLSLTRENELNENQKEKYIFTYEKKNPKKHIVTNKKNKSLDCFVFGVATAIIIGKIIQNQIRK